MGKSQNTRSSQKGCGRIQHSAERVGRAETTPPCLFRSGRQTSVMNLAVETEQETDGRWIAEIPQIPGALVYGADRREAIARVEALALRILAERLEVGR